MSLQVGDRVRVRAGVRPANGWGFVREGHVGTIRSLTQGNLFRFGVFVSFFSGVSSEPDVWFGLRLQIGAQLIFPRKAHGLVVWKKWSELTLSLLRPHLPQDPWFARFATYTLSHTHGYVHV
jgi:hypothetical protein